MYLPADPFKDCCSHRIIETIYGFSKTYEEDIINLIDLLGGQNNIQLVKQVDRPAMSKSSCVDYKHYEIWVQEYEKVDNFLSGDYWDKFTTINGFCHVRVDGRNIIVSAARQMQRLMEEWCEYYKQEEDKIVKETQTEKTENEPK